MRDIPVIMSAPMVCATIEDRKTNTRRLAWSEPFAASDDAVPLTKGWKRDGDLWRKPSPWQKVKPGDRLWVRENFSGPRMWTGVPPGGWIAPPGPKGETRRPRIWYWADGNPQTGDWTKPRPSIHMPRWASRLTLIVTATKMERLQDISHEDACAEGASDDNGPGTMMGFINIWHWLHGEESWNANPDVVAVSFRVIKANIDSKEARVA